MASIFKDVNKELGLDTPLNTSGSIFADINKELMSDKIDLEGYTVGERAADVGKAFLRLPEHLSGTVGKVMKFAADYEPGLEAGPAKPLVGLFRKIQPAWHKRVEESSRTVLRTHGEEIADFWTKAANTGFEAPSDELMRARQQEWYRAPVTRALTAVADSGGPFLVSAATSVITKNPQIGLALLGAMTTADTYDELTDAGVDRDIAQNISLLTGAFEAVTEKIPFDTFMGNSGKSLLKKFIKSGSMESLQEFVQNTGENYFKHFGYNYDPDDPESVPRALKIEWGELLNGWFESISAGFLMGEAGSLMSQVSNQVNNEFNKGSHDLSLPALTQMQTQKGTTPSRTEIDAAKEALEKGENVPPTIGEDADGNPVLLDGDAAIIAANELGQERLNVEVKVSDDTAARLVDESIHQEVADRQEIPTNPAKAAENIMAPDPSVKSIDVKTEEAIGRTVQNLTDSAVNWKDLTQDTAKMRSKEWAKRFGEAKTVMESDTGQAAFARAKAQLAGEMPIAQFELANPIPGEDLFLLQERIRTSKKLTLTEKINTEEALTRVFGGQAPAPFQIKLFERAFGKEFAQAASALERMSLTTQEKLKRTVLGIINIPHAMLASCDLSATGRQGLFAGVSHPLLLAGMTKAGLKSFVSDKAANLIDTQIRTNKYFEGSQQHGIVIRDYGTASTNKADHYQTEFMARNPDIDKLTGLRRIMAEIIYIIPTTISASERAYVTALNKFRMDLYSNYAQRWEGSNKTTSDYKALANLINHATGESRNKFIEDHAALFNAGFFAPRWTVSRFELVGDLALTTPEVRKIAAKMWVNYLVAGVTALGLLAMAGFDVEEDPRSSDFGKVKYGTTRFDFFGGYTQIARFTAQMFTGQKKATTSGRISDQDRLYTIGRFLESKSSPVAGLTIDLLRGETFIGDDVYTTDSAELKEQVFNRIAPLFLQDVRDAYIHQGLGFVSKTAALPFLGIGMQTYPLRPHQELQMEKDYLAKQTFGKAWDEIGPLAQKGLYKYHPELEVKERQVEMERSNEEKVEIDLSEQRKAGLAVKESLPDFVQDEMDRLLIKTSGLSRRVSSGWNLNDERYQDYQDKVSKALNTILPQIMKHPTWMRMTEDQQRELTEYVISKAKSTARQILISNANINDLVSLKERR